VKKNWFKNLIILSLRSMSLNLFLWRTCWEEIQDIMKKLCLSKF